MLACCVAEIFQQSLCLKYFRKYFMVISWVRLRCTWFPGLRQLSNAAIETGVFPTGMLRGLLYPLDKVPGKVDLKNKRPIGLCEALAQAGGRARGKLCYQVHFNTT